MREYIEWFNQVLTVAIQLYFHQESEYKQLKDVYPPRNGWMEAVTGQMDTNFEERIVIMLALMPHICPQILDIFFGDGADPKYGKVIRDMIIIGNGCGNTQFIANIKAIDIRARISFGIS